MVFFDAQQMKISSALKDINPLPGFIPDNHTIMQNHHEVGMSNGLRAHPSIDVAI